MELRDTDSVRIVELCLQQGFALAGVCDAAPTEYEQQVRNWIAAGKQGEMSYLSKNLSAMLDPNEVLPGAKAILCVADRYHDGRRTPQPEPGEGRIATYARGDDYHKVIKKRLHSLCDELAQTYPDHQFRACVDTAPLLEREYAQRAGLGAVGKHTLLIEPGVGSYLLFGEILTTLPLQSSERETRDPCGECTRCIDACPTDAITPWSVDATRCISYLTIEHRSPIDEQFFEGIDNWIFGCDVCQDVCPHNQPTRRSRRSQTHEAYAENRDRFGLLEVLGWSEDDRRAAFTKSAMKRAKLNMMKRNALIAAGNAIRIDPDSETSLALRRRIAELVGHETEDAMVRETAAAVQHRLDRGV